MKYLIILIVQLLLFYQGSQKLTQLAYEFDPTMIQEDIDDLWTSQYGLKTVVSCHDSRKFGPHGGLNGVHLFKTYYLPPHWSLSISVELYMIWDWGGEEVSMRIGSDTIFQKTYAREVYANKHNCESSGDQYSNFDLFIPYSMNITHTDTTMDLHIESNMSSVITTRALAISNLYVTVDTCYYTCETCTGPDYDECLTCPENALFLVGECLCNPGYTMQDYRCQANIVCPFDWIEFEEQRTCVPKCLIDNCEECPDFESMVCTECKPLFKLLDNRCIDKCPFWSSDAGVRCLDQTYDLMKRPYTLAQELINNDFSSADVQHSGWVYSNFDTQTVYNINNTPISSYAANKCDGLTLAIGFAYLPQNNCAGGCSMTKTWNNIPQHFQIKVRYQLWAGDLWNGDTFEILVDGQSIDIHTYTYTDSTPNREFVCANDNYIQNYIFDKDLPFISHTQDSVTVEFKWTIASNLNQAWVGLRDFSILVDQCENSNCNTCATAGETCGSCKGDQGELYSRIITSNCSCPVGYENIETMWNCQLIVCQGTADQPYSRNPKINCQCPKQYFDDPEKVECQECLFPCETCESSATNCLTCAEGDNRLEAPSCRCSDGYFQNIRQVCEKCSEGCVTCTSSDECTQKEAKSSFWIDYWYIIGIGVIILFFIVFFIYKVIVYYDKKNKIEVININETKEQEDLDYQQKIKEQREKALDEMNKLRKKPKNNPKKGKTSWGFKNLPGQFNSERDMGRDNSRKNTFADDLSINDNLQEPNTAQTFRNRRHPVESAGGYKYGKGTVIDQKSQAQISGSQKSLGSRSDTRQQSYRYLGQTGAKEAPKDEFADIRNKIRSQTATGTILANSSNHRSKFARYNLQ